MTEQIRIKKSKSQLVKGDRTMDFLDGLEIREPEKEVLQEEAYTILDKALASMRNKNDSTTGLAFGYVQSGKTMSFTALTTLAADNGVGIVIYLAGTNNNLVNQTNERLFKDLKLNERKNKKRYKIFSNPEPKESAIILRQLSRKKDTTLLIPILKHTLYIDNIVKIFKSHEFAKTMKDKRVLIIDDEADQASLNTYARKNNNNPEWEEDETSATYSSILKLKSNLPGHIYIQYTATPQGPVLINMMDLLSPKFHVVLTPGEDYTGGKTFFVENPDLIISIPEEEVYHNKKNDLQECPDSLMDALQVYLISVAIQINILENEDFLSMMVHADREIDVTNKFYTWIENILNAIDAKLELAEKDPMKKELISRLRQNYKEAVKKIDTPPSFEEVLSEIQDVIDDTEVRQVIGKEEKKKPINWKKTQYSSHILVGADLLNRGFTVERLAVTYMPRHPVGKQTADTMQQRARFFGYKKKYLKSCRVYLPQKSINEFKDYVIHEEYLREGLKTSTLNEVRQEIILSNELNPTRSNIISEKILRHKMTGWKQLRKISSPSYLKDNINYIEKAFIPSQKFDLFEDYKSSYRNHNFTELPINEVITFISNFKTDSVPDVVRKSKTIEYLNTLSNTGKIKSAYIFDMAFSEPEGRLRAVVDNEINQLFTGRDRKGGTIYPGDNKIRVDESFCIQIHRVKINNEFKPNHGKKVYTLAFYYPESLSTSFISVLEPNHY